MRTTAFIGLGNMGAGMAANLVKAGHEVLAFDLSAAALDRATRDGCQRASSAAEAAAASDVVITMLPAGAHARQGWAEAGIPNAKPAGRCGGCSTLDAASARRVTAEASPAALQ